VILLTGGAGYFGDNFVLDRLGAQANEGVVKLDKLTYAGNLATLVSLKSDPRHIFVHSYIGDKEVFTKLLKVYRPKAILNFSDEGHMDRSIHGLADFVQTKMDCLLVKLKL
jgi:dTDP-glucose 4,6-dehydratase